MNYYGDDKVGRVRLSEERYLDKVISLLCVTMQCIQSCYEKMAILLTIIDELCTDFYFCLAFFLETFFFFMVLLKPV